MRVNRLYLKNYIGIKHGLSLKEIELLFNDRKIVLLVGENGSGKTTIMSAINPFPDNKMVIPGKTAVKEIELENGRLLYKIQHHYKPNGQSHKVSSFIQKIDNGVVKELNPNGNVTSFKEVIEVELGITDEYLSLIQLGSAFGSFIKKTTSERSKYISKFLGDIDIYLQYYKKLSNDARLLKNVIKNISDKLDHIGDIESIKSKLDKTMEDIKTTSQDKTKLLAHKMYLEQTLDNLDIDTNLELEIDEKDMQVVLDKLQQLGIDINLGEDGFLSMLSTKLNNTKDKIESTNNSISDIKYIIADYDEQIEDLNIKIESINIEECNNVINKYNSKVMENKLLQEEYGFNLEINIPKYTKKELFQAVGLLDNYFQEIEDMHQHFDEGMFEKAFNEYDTDYYSIIYKLTAKENNLSNNIANLEGKYEVTRTKYDNVLNNLDRRSPKCTIDNCPLLGGNAKELEQQLYELEEELESSKKELTQIQEDKLYYGNIINIIDTVKSIEKSYNMNIEVFKNIPFIKNSLSEYKNEVIQCKPFYENYILEKYSDIIESYELYLDQIESIKDLHEYYIECKQSIESLTDYENSLNSVIKTRELYDKKMKTLMETYAILKDLRLKLLEVESEKEKYSSIITYKNNNDLLIANCKKAKEIQSNLKELESISNELDKNEIYLNNLKDELFVKYNQYKKYISEKQLFMDKYNDVRLLKDAVSPNKGIPLIYIDIYLQQVRIVANELLDKAFNGTMHFEDFVINEKEFRIPFTKTEYTDDISKGSEGLKSILSLALSFAFIHQVSSSFNLMFLDEVDGPLDKKNRKKFAFAVQKQMDILNMEQIFIITHNDSFFSKNSGYILLKGSDLDNVNKKDIIYQY